MSEANGILRMANKVRDSEKEALGFNMFTPTIIDNEEYITNLTSGRECRQWYESLKESDVAEAAVFR